MARLTTRQRHGLSSGEFAGPGRSYPIPDKGHAIDALAMVSRFGSPGLKARVRAAVHRKFPGIKMAHAPGPQAHPEHRTAHR